MSISIYGYAELSGRESYDGLIAIFQSIKLIRVVEKHVDTLYNWPVDLLPKVDFVAFHVYDGELRDTAEYILDYVDYARGSAIGLPASKDERLRIFTSAVSEVANFYGVLKLLLAITECNQIECTADVQSINFSALITSDLRLNSFPNKLYVISKTQAGASV